MNKNVLAISLFANLCFAVFLGQKIIQRLQKQEVQKVSHSEVRLDQFSSYPTPKDTVVLIGDSLIERGQWDELIPETKTVNRGISGATFKSYLDTGIIQRLDSSNKVIILLGINNFWNGETYPQIFEQFLAFKSAIKEKNFKSVSFVKLLPTFLSDLDKRSEDILNLNLEIAKSFSDTEIIDLSQELSSPQYFIDGVHLNGSGYQVVGTKISSLLK